MKSFLIVEDSPPLIKYCHLLINARFKDALVTCVHNGREALKKAREREYSVILSDIEMPVMDGIEFYKELKKESPLLAKRIAFMSSSNISSHFECITKEELPFLHKPFNPHDFHALIDKVLTCNEHETMGKQHANSLG